MPIVYPFHLMQMLDGKKHVYECECPLSQQPKRKTHPSAAYCSNIGHNCEVRVQKNVCVCKCVTTWNRLERNGDTVATVAPAANSESGPLFSMRISFS